MKTNTLSLSSDLRKSRYKFSKTSKSQYFLLIMTLILISKDNASLVDESNSTVWFDSDIELNKLDSPLEVIAKADLQNFLNLRNEMIDKRLIKLGIIYAKNDDGLDRDPSYITIFKFKNNYSNEQLFSGFEYRPSKDDMEKASRTKGRMSFT